MAGPDYDVQTTRDPQVHRRHCELARWSTGALISPARWTTGVLVHRCPSQPARWSTGALIHRCAGPPAPWSTDVLVNRRAGPPARWSTGVLAPGPPAPWSTRRVGQLALWSINAMFMCSTDCTGSTDALVGAPVHWFTGMLWSCEVDTPQGTKLNFSNWHNRCVSK